MKSYLKTFNDNNKPFRVVLAGSSVTAQDWIAPNWPQWLAYSFHQNGKDWDKDWRKKIINSARDGAKPQHYIDNFEAEIAMFKPHLVICSLGLNAIQPKLDEGKFTKELIRLFKLILQSGSDLCIWSPYAIPNNKFINSLSKVNDIYKKLAKELDLIYIDMFSEFQKYDLSKLFTLTYPWDNEHWNLKKGDTDFLHCNELGNFIIAKKLLKEIFDFPIVDFKFGNIDPGALEKKIDQAIIKGNKG